MDGRKDGWMDGWARDEAWSARKSEGNAHAGCKALRASPAIGAR